MVMINRATKEMTMKIVFYGPGLCGKTTNLEYIFEKANPEKKGKLLSVATETDRTLFFDFLPMELGTIKGMKLRVQLYTVPGQVFYDATRRIVLRGSDGVVFVADSQAAMLAANQESVENLLKNLRLNSLDPDTIPLVFQYNKQDLPDLSTLEELEEALNFRKLPSFKSVATTGVGVNETLKKVIELVIRSLARKEASLKHPAQAAQPAAEPAPAPPPPPPPEPPPEEPPPAAAPAEQEPLPPEKAPEPVMPPELSREFEFSRRGEFEVDSAEEIGGEPEVMEMEEVEEVDESAPADGSAPEPAPEEVELEEVELEEVHSIPEIPPEVEENPPESESISEPPEIPPVETADQAAPEPVEMEVAVVEEEEEEQDRPLGSAQDNSFDAVQDRSTPMAEPSAGSKFDKILASYRTEIDGTLERLHSLVSDLEDLKKRIANLEDRLKP